MSRTIVLAEPPTLVAANCKQRPRNRERERTAYHEAGHAVIDHTHGITVKRVSIIADDESLGRVHDKVPRWMREIDYNMTPYREIKVHQHIMANLAGAAAVAIYANYGTWRGAGTDLQTATAMADCVTSGPEETNALLGWLWIRTRRTLVSPPTWTWVEAVATALLAHHELTGEQFRSLLTEVMQTQFKETLAQIASETRRQGCEALQ